MVPRRHKLDSHTGVHQVVGEVTDACVAVVTLNVLAVRADHHARVRLPRKDPVAILRFEGGTVGGS